MSGSDRSSSARTENATAPGSHRRLIPPSQTAPTQVPRSPHHEPTQVPGFHTTVDAPSIGTISERRSGRGTSGAWSGGVPWRRTHRDYPPRRVGDDRAAAPRLRPATTNPPIHPNDLALLGESSATIAQRNAQWSRGGRDQALGAYGHVVLLLLVGLRRSGLVVGFALVIWGADAAMAGGAGTSGVRRDALHERHHLLHDRLR